MPANRSKLSQHYFARERAWTRHECLGDLWPFGFNATFQGFGATNDQSEMAQPTNGLWGASVEVMLNASISWPFVLLLVTTATALEFGLPIDCEVGRSCVIQNYVD